MTHRISAGAIVESDGRLLLVRHYRPGRYDFWVAPGGGVKGDESLAASVVGGTLDTSHPEAAAEYIVQAAWLAAEELRGITVFPPVLTGRYWSDRLAGFPGVVHLPLRQMEFS